MGHSNEMFQVKSLCIIDRVPRPIPWLKRDVHISLVPYISRFKRSVVIRQFYSYANPKLIDVILMPS